MTEVTISAEEPLNATDQLLPSQDGVLPENESEHPVMIKIVDDQ